MTKNKVTSEISLVLVPANMFLVPANIFLRKKHCGIMILTAEDNYNYYKTKTQKSKAVSF